MLLTSGAPAGQAADPVLVIRASRSGWVDVTFPSAFSVSVGEPNVIAIKGRYGGRYAGFYAERLGQPYAPDSDHFGVVRASRDTSSLRAYADVQKSRTPVSDRWPYNPYPDAAAPVTYAAGTYRFYVVADQQFEMQLPVTGLTKSVVVTPSPKKPLRVSYTTKDLTATGPAYELRHPIAIGARTVAVAMTHQTFTPPWMHATTTCFASGGQPCSDAPDLRSSGAVGTPGNDYVAWSGAIAAPGALAAGSWESAHRLVSAPASSDVIGYVLTFDAPA